MGAADIVPGVSGGTVALILGIYQRLVGAISSFDVELLGLLAGGRWRDAAQRIDLRFLVGLGVGILTGVASLASAMQYLLQQQRSYTLAVFFGLILASSLLVARTVRPKSAADAKRCLLAGVAAAAVALAIVMLEQLNNPPDHLAYYFFCGSVAICAMILPGVSGAFLLVMLGIYANVTDIIHKMIHLDAAGSEWATLIVFAAGCGVGLLSFSKLLRWLLQNAHATTMSVLCGFMVGSLWKLWPFQEARDTNVELKHRVYDHVAAPGGSALLAQFILPAAAALSLVLIADRWATKRAAVGGRVAPQMPASDSLNRG